MRKQLSKLGAFTRPKRESLAISLGEMAAHLKVSSARLSTVELNPGPFPESWIKPISEILRLNDDQVAELKAIQSDHLISRLGQDSQNYGKLLSDLNKLKHQIPEEGFDALRQLAQNLADPSNFELEFKNGTLP